MVRACRNRDRRPAGSRHGATRRLGTLARDPGKVAAAAGANRGEGRGETAPPADSLETTPGASRSLHTCLDHSAALPRDQLTPCAAPATTSFARPRPRSVTGWRKRPARLHRGAHDAPATWKTLAIHATSEPFGPASEGGEPCIGVGRNGARLAELPLRVPEPRRAARFARASACACRARRHGRGRTVTSGVTKSGPTISGPNSGAPGSRTAIRMPVGASGPRVRRSSATTRSCGRPRRRPRRARPRTATEMRRSRGPTTAAPRRQRPCRRRARAWRCTRDDPWR